MIYEYIIYKIGGICVCMSMYVNIVGTVKASEN